MTTAPDKSPRRIREMFDRISPTYDLLNHVFSLNIDQRWRKLAAAECPREGLILDLCCGTGDLALAVASKSNARIIGADFSFQMLRFGIPKVAGRPIRLIQADALTLPFADNTFDACTVAFGVRNLSSARRGLEEIRRVLRPGGKAVIVEFAVPQTPVIRQMYSVYMTRVMSAVGDAVSRSRAYRYLSNSVEAWHNPESFCALLSDCRFTSPQAQALTFGIANLYTGLK
jgi:demethylmenaquinone methyltransferase/2-methoxy-6-polyprenyl-1,4-benzoquinol methylase